MGGSFTSSAERRWVSAVLLLVLVACATTGSEIGSDVGAPYVGVDGASGATRRYLPVSFETHDDHVEWLGGDCRKCHHGDGAGGETNRGVERACRDCHAHAPGPMHKSCRGCHFAIVRDRPDSTAPIECLECHVERKLPG